ncbi:autotransporter outer membrane beta-barrel domain-containing protein [Erwinia sp. J316]|uniref:Autotransporter outer membrane beta-barrel domain-containing protein n=1 Tax=Erwinia sorbitola TaxID=2681984 RepID=A0ABW9RGZ3_9GAMM|nr:autotransporter outer membrane beta-barrel domain-containing protein [Erwinia sorbitola]
MRVFRKRFSFNLITLVLFPLSALASSTWEVNDGTQLQVSQGNTTTGEKQPTLSASGKNSVLTTDPGLNFITTGDVSHGLQVSDGAEANINKASISTQGDYAHGAEVDQGTLKMNGGNIHVSGDNSFGISATGNSTVDLKNTNITLGQTLNEGIDISGGTLNGSGLVLTANKPLMLNVIELSNRAQAILKDTQIILNGRSSSFGIHVNDATLNASGLIINASNKGQGILVEKSSQPGDALILSDSSISTQGENATAISSRGQSVLNNVNLNTSGDFAHGLSLEYGGTAQVNGGHIETSGRYAHGIWLTTEDSALQVKDTVFSISGDNGIAVSATAGKASLDHLQATISGEGGRGIVSQTQLDAKNINVLTVGKNTTGVQSSGAKANMTLSNSSITTTGSSGTGIVASGGGKITADGTTLTTKGKQSIGVILRNGTLGMTNSSIATMDGPGLYVDSSATSEVSLDNTQLASGGFSAVQTVGSGLNLNLTNGTVVTGGNGDVLNAMTAKDSQGADVRNSQVNVMADNATLNGNVLSDSLNNQVDLNLKNGSTLTGYTKNVSSMMLDQASVWNVTGDSDLNSLQLDGHAQFDGKEFHTLTVNNDLSGSGVIGMNVQLDDDSSPGDRLNVKGNATGKFTVNITNKDGKGAQTQMGIPVINVAGETGGVTFTQSKPVLAGNYEYFLNPVNSHDWYLQSSYKPTTSTIPNTPIPTRAYRPETAGYLMGPYLNAAYAYTAAGTYHQRLGARQGDKAVWGRIYGRHDLYGAGRFGYDGNTVFMQLGSDLWRGNLAPDFEGRSGVMVTIGDIHTNARDYARSERSGLSVNTGKIKTTAYSVGGYFTAEADDGMYLDTVGQMTWYRNRFKSAHDSRQSSYSSLLSAEMGMPFTVSGLVKLEPQLQLMGQYLHSGEIRSHGVKVNRSHDFLGQARGGVRMFYDHKDIQPWLQADVVQRMGNLPGITMNDENLTPHVHSGWWQIGAGVRGKVNKEISLYADVNYQHGFGQGIEGYGGNIGMKYEF